MKPKINHVWVVEMRNPDNGRYEPTVGCGIDREHGRAKVSEWKRHNPTDLFRLRKYETKERK